MDSDVTMKKSLTMKRIILLSVAMELAAAAFAILTILSTNLARAQDGSGSVQPDSPPSPVTVESGGLTMIQPPHLILEQAVADGIITHIGDLTYSCGHATGSDQVPTHGHDNCWQ